MFFDNASTTKVDVEILEEFKRINEEHYYNPGGLYAGGRSSKQFLENSCRKGVLKCLNATGNLIFTGSATEANNMALFGFVKKNTKKILVSMGEHPSVYNSALELKNRGFDVVFVNLDKSGCVDFQDFCNKMTPDVDLVSIMHVSNETGAINDIASLVDYSKEINPKVVFHCDGVQAVGKIDVDIDDLGVDMYTMSAHKIHGLKGVGALFVKSSINLKPIIFGGGQEQGLRSGTENLLGIYSLACSVVCSSENLDNNFKYILSLKNKFLSMLEFSNIKYKLHSTEGASPYIVSIGFDGCRAETLLNMLSDRGVFVGNGSACSSKNMGNRILENMGIDRSGIEGNLRISFSKYNTENEVKELVDVLNEVVEEYVKKVR